MKRTTVSGGIRIGLDIMLYVHHTAPSACTLHGETRAIARDGVEISNNTAEGLRLAQLAAGLSAEGRFQRIFFKRISFF